MTGIYLKAMSVLPIAVSAGQDVRKSQKEGNNYPTVDVFSFSHHSVSLYDESFFALCQALGMPRP